MRPPLRANLVFLLAAALGCSPAGADAAEADLRVDPEGPRRPISPLIYGGNHDVEGFRFTDARRLGGNRLTPYNWEIDASNAGKDYRHQNDRWLTKNDWWRGDDLADAPEPGEPAAAIHRFHQASLDRGSYSLVTVPLAGFVAGDADGPVEEDKTAPSPRWSATAASSDRPDRPDPADGTVYADQLVAHLVETYGGAGTDAGINGYSLDNEPALWHRTHPRLHPEQATIAELLEASVATAEAIKQTDPGAETYGPALWGITAYASLSKAADWKNVKAAGGFDWFIDAYLAAMAEASEDAGVRLLDALDVHWYTESPQGRDLEGFEAARSGRALYDPDHVEPSWVGEHFSRFLPLLPRLQASIDEHFPGTKIAITEYDWPMTGTVFGGLAQADALGAFGTHGVHFASYHHYTAKKPDAYVGAAFNLYRDFDGEGGRFGDTSIPLELDTDAEVRGYAAIDEAAGTLHLILLNHEAEATVASFELPGTVDAEGVRAFHFDASSPEVRPLPEAPTADAGGLRLTLPATSAAHLVLPIDLP